MFLRSTCRHLFYYGGLQLGRTSRSELKRPEKLQYYHRRRDQAHLAGKMKRAASAYVYACVITKKNRAIFEKAGKSSTVSLQKNKIIFKI